MNPSRTLRLLHLTDTHLLGDRQARLRGVATFDTLQAVYRHALQNFPQPHGVLLTGDLVQDDPAGYAHIRATFERSATPVYCLPGNHDAPEAMRAALSQSPFVHDMAVQLDSWLLVLLNSWQPDQAGGRLGEQQLTALEQLLQQHRQRHTLICLHHHPLRMHSEWLDEVGLADAAELHNCMARHQQVRGVLWGHVHQALDRQLDGVRYMSTPATCVQFLPRSDDFAVDTRPPGYRTLLLHADGGITSEVIWLESLSLSQGAQCA